MPPNSGPKNGSDFYEFMAVPEIGSPSISVTEQHTENRFSCGADLLQFA